ncbi:MAG: glycine cleavage T C-terminal barrel domain-containing protein [Cyanobacteria bacterium J06607_13]
MASQTSAPLLFDRSHWGCIRLTGADRVRFLHNQTTNHIEQLSAGQGCRTVFVTSTGRTIDLATVYAFADALLVIVSPGMAQQLYDWMDRYIFFSDKVTLADESEQMVMLTVLGEGCDDVVRSLGAEALIGQPTFTHQAVPLVGTDSNVHIAVGSDLAIAGYTLWAANSVAAQLKQSLLSAGATLADQAQWEQLRIQQGRPMPAHELTDDENPLEAGLWHSISFEKGCYIGQETIARLNTYQGVKKRLWGLALSAPVPENASIFQAGSPIGKVTSITQSETGPFALGYIRTKAGGEGLTVDIDGTQGEVTALPFIHHEYHTSPPKE